MVKKTKKLNKVDIISLIICFLGLFLFFLALFIKTKFNDLSFELLLYTLKDTEGANYSIVFIGAAFIFIRIILIVAGTYIIYKLYKSLKIKVKIKIGFKNKLFKYNLFKYNKLKTIIFSIILFIVLLYSSMTLINLDDYIKGQFNASTLFEDYYVDAKDTKLKFPEKKRNLIYIYAESMESSNISKENGGLVETSYIPNLEEMALNNINFSNTEKIGGAIQVNNTSWTMAALISHTSGVPLKVSIDVNSYKNYSASLPGLYNLGDILEENGYNNYFMIGSDANFGGRKDYFESHGNYTIYDYYYAKDNGYIDEDYYVWWGYEDQRLFKHAKEKILEASKEDEPFNFTILTVDTHFTDGYMDDSCEEVFDKRYANAFYCSDSKIAKFVKWIKEQDFYEDTTVIITGDHLTMQSNFYGDIDNNNRMIYNTFINSVIEPYKAKNRLFSTLDMFPTTLASIGVEIEGDRLGLGTNLFSKEKTLIEKFGIDYINEELGKKSNYYNKFILGNTYYEMEEELSKEQ